MAVLVELGAFVAMRKTRQAPWELLEVTGVAQSPSHHLVAPPIEFSLVGLVTKKVGYVL